MEEFLDMLGSDTAFAGSFLSAGFGGADIMPRDVVRYVQGALQSFYKRSLLIKWQVWLRNSPYGYGGRSRRGPEAVHEVPLGVFPLKR
jgi:hypothetical protein